MESITKEQSNENKLQGSIEEIEDNSFICLIIRSLSDVFIRYDVFLTI